MGLWLGVIAELFVEVEDWRRLNGNKNKGLNVRKNGGLKVDDVNKINEIRNGWDKKKWM